MTKVSLRPGQPIAESSGTLGRLGIPTAIPTGEATTASSRAWLATATGSGTAHTKGSWTEIVSATTKDTYGLLVGSTGTFVATTDTSALLDIGVGGSGSEVVVVPDLAMGSRYGAANLIGPLPFYRVPIFIPAGSRIAIRCQGAQTSKAIAVSLTPLARMAGQRQPSTSVVTLNANSATSAGTSLGTPGGNNTKTSWTQLVAATAEPFSALMVGFQLAADTVQGDTNTLVDIGFGAAASEVVAISNIFVNTSLQEVVNPFDQGAWMVNVPTGTRIAGRFAETSTTSTLDLIVYGIR